MTLLLSIALATTGALGSTIVGGAPAPAIVGEVTYYNPNVMEAVYANRLAWGHVEPCPECIGMVALREREHLGKRVWITRPGHEPEGPFLSADCAALEDYPRLERRGLVAEVDYQTAMRWGMNGPIKGVTVSFDGKVNNERGDMEADSGLRRLVLRQ